MQHIIKKNKRYFNFILVIFLIGILSGIIYFQFLNHETKNEIIETIKLYKTFNSNYIIKDLIVMSVILVSSFFVIGLPIVIFYYFYECLSFGFIFNVFIVTFKLKGIIYSLIYIILNRFIYLILMILFIKKIINISSLVIGLLINKNNNNIKIINNFKNAIYIILFVLIINIVIYFISPIVLEKLSFLLN